MTMASNEMSGEEREHLGGYGGSEGDDDFIGGAKRGSFTASTDLSFDKTAQHLAFVGREEIGSEDFIGNEEIDGDGFVGRAEEQAMVAAEGGRRAGVGSTRYASYTAQTDLAKTSPGEGYALVAGRKLGKPSWKNLKRNLGFKGKYTGPGAEDLKTAHQTRRQIMQMVRAGQAVPAALVDQFVGALNRAHLARRGSPADKSKTERWKGKLLSQIARKNGKVHGDIMSGMGDWVSKVFSVPGKVISKGLEYGARTAYGVTKAVVYDAPKATFFAKGKKKTATTSTAAQRASGASRAPAAVQDQEDYGATTADLSTYARRIAQKRADIKRRQASLQSRLELAQSKQALAAQEDAEETALADLEAKAAEAEAEAEAADSSSGGDDPAAVVSAIAKDRATQARIAQAVVKSAGPAAKAILFGNPFVKFARQIWLEAKVDTKGAAKAAALKKAAEGGDQKATQTLQTLAAGKQAEDQLQAANVVNTALSQKAAEAKGVPDDVVGMLPSNEKVISVVPGAKAVYALAKQGNPKAVAAVRKGGDVMRRAAAGDPKAREQIRQWQSGAAGGNQKDQLNMAVVAVSAAGLRENKALGLQRAAAKKAAAAVTAEKSAEKSAEFRSEMDSLVAPLRKLGQSYGEGLAVKLTLRR